MTDGIPIIPSKKLKSLCPALYVIVDGANLTLHPQKRRLLCSSDSIEIDYLTREQHLDPSSLNIESLYNTLLYLQGTALNIAGVQRIFIRTDTDALISVDPRLNIPPLFEDFLTMMNTLVKNQLVVGPGGERLMKFVKSDVSLSLLPNVPHFAIYVKRDEPLVGPGTFVGQDPCCVFARLNPEEQSNDEVMQGRFCLSNDQIGCAGVISRVVRATEAVHEIW
jgi:rRNA pseudouridine-1189 N-methylase Emg1 (Nep1/Mra1 family)